MYKRYRKYKRSLKLICHQKNVTKNKMSPKQKRNKNWTRMSTKLKGHQNWNVIQTENSPKLKCHQKLNVTNEILLYNSRSSVLIALALFCQFSVFQLNLGEVTKAADTNNSLRYSVRSFGPDGCWPTQKLLWPSQQTFLPAPGHSLLNQSGEASYPDIVELFSNFF